MTTAQLDHLQNEIEDSELLAGVGGGFGLRFQTKISGNSLQLALSFEKTLKVDVKKNVNEDEIEPQSGGNNSNLKVKLIRLEKVGDQVIQSTVFQKQTDPLMLGRLGAVEEGDIPFFQNETIRFSRRNSRNPINLKKAAEYLSNQNKAFECHYPEGALVLKPKAESISLAEVVMDFCKVTFLDWITTKSNSEKMTTAGFEIPDSLGSTSAEEGETLVIGNEVESECFFDQATLANCKRILNSGKNLIITGAPGSGKTQLAKALAKAAGKDQPTFHTASPAWTTDELIGRYLPRNDGKGLRFAPGYFLSAIEADTDNILIIDEINRCDLDSCFGELFTVLSGVTTTLPFFDLVENEDTGEEEEASVVVGPQDTSDSGLTTSSARTFYFGKKFRIIGTMNTNDAGRLHEFSDALLRRFAFVELQKPSESDDKKGMANAVAGQVKIGNLAATKILIHTGNLRQNTPLRHLANWFYPLCDKVPEIVSPAILLDLCRLFELNLLTLQNLGKKGAAGRARAVGFKRRISLEDLADKLKETARLLLAHWKVRLGSESDQWKELSNTIESLGIINDEEEA